MRLRLERGCRGGKRGERNDVDHVGERDEFKPSGQFIFVSNTKHTFLTVKAYISTAQNRGRRMSVMVEENWVLVWKTSDEIPS